MEDEEDGREDGDDGQSNVSDRRWLAPIFRGTFSKADRLRVPHNLETIDDVMAVKGIVETRRAALRLCLGAVGVRAYMFILFTFIFCNR